SGAAMLFATHLALASPARSRLPSTQLPHQRRARIRYLALTTGRARRQSPRPAPVSEKPTRANASHKRPPPLPAWRRFGGPARPTPPRENRPTQLPRRPPPLPTAPASVRQANGHATVTVAKRHIPPPRRARQSW